MKNIGKAIAGSSMSGKASEENHFYPTPPEPTKALIKFYWEVLKNKQFHEASCGDGAICEVLKEFNLPFLATDLIERGHGNNLLGDSGYADLNGIDYLRINKNNYPCGKFSTIQNPPFKHWGEFVSKSHELKMPFIAMFAKISVWNAAKRLEVYEKYPPKAVHPLTWRVDFNGMGRPTMDCCWCVWGDEVSFSNEPMRRG